MSTTYLPPVRPPEQPPQPPEQPPAPPPAPPAPPQPPKPKGHRRAWIAAGAAAVLLAGGIGIGVAAASGGTSSPPAPATSSQPASPSQPTQPKPAYDLAGFLAATTGPEQQAVSADLSTAATDATNLDLAALEQDGRNLETDAGAWLTVLQATNPPPQYQHSRTHLIEGVRHIRNAAQLTVQGAATGDLSIIEQATSELNAGATEIQNATDALPGGGIGA